MDLHATVDAQAGADDTAGTDNTVDKTVDNTGLAHGQLLIAYADAVVGATDQVESLRIQLLDAVGPEATAHAAMTVMAFSGLVRVADGTGIPIDDGLAAASVEIREDLALAKLGGAANSNVEGVDQVEFSTIGHLFGG